MPRAGARKTHGPRRPAPGHVAHTATTTRAVATARSLALIVFAILRRAFALALGRGGRRGLADPADMGTAFGLDASTFLEPESAEEIAARAPATPISRFEHRLHRRSSF